jgi:hypothetical protein
MIQNGRVGLAPRLDSVPRELPVRIATLIAAASHTFFLYLVTKTKGTWSVIHTMPAVACRLTLPSLTAVQ